MLTSSRTFHKTPDKRDSIYYYDYHANDEQQHRNAITVSEQRTVGILK